MVSPIEQRYIDLHPGSRQRHERARDIFPDGVTHDARRLKPFQLYYTHAEGAAKYDVDGNKILDFFPGHGALMLGHSNPEIVAAVQEQMAKGTHLSGNTDLEIEWGELVKELIPSAERVRFHSSGTEADMMAIRMARAYTGKTKIIKFEDHFHGWSDYAVAGSTEGIGGIPQETLSTMIVLPANDIAIVEKTIRESGDVAGIILEPTGAHMGYHPILPSFLQELRDLADRTGVVLIFDEVVTGFRISRGGAQGYYGVTPDLTTLAKILGGGLPGGAVCGKAEIINMIQATDDPEFNRTRRIAHNGTFNANPLAAAAGVTMLRKVRDFPINDTANARAQRLKDGLNDLLGRMEIPGCANGVASLPFLRLGVDHECDKEICMLTPEQEKLATNPVRSHQLGLALMNHGVQAGTRFILTAAHTEEDIDFTIDAYEKALSEIREVGLI
jgi:glutamate-1-semialdehyde 2,1-aminomutase